MLCVWEHISRVQSMWGLMMPMGCSENWFQKNHLLFNCQVFLFTSWLDILPLCTCPLPIFLLHQNHSKWGCRNRREMRCWRKMRPRTIIYAWGLASQIISDLALENIRVYNLCTSRPFQSWYSMILRWKVLHNFTIFWHIKQRQHHFF